MPSTLRMEYADAHHRRQVVTLTSGERNEWHVGRRNGSFTPDINLTWAADEGVSRRHARITYDAGAWYLEPLSHSSPTSLNEQPLLPGVPVELPADALVRMGRFPLHLRSGGIEHLPEGSVTPVSSRGDDLPEAVPEKDRFEVMARIAQSLAKSGPGLLDDLVEVIRTCFPAAVSGGIALYRDKEIATPAFFPRGAAQISFRLARRALDSQNLIRWDRVVVSGSSAGYTSLIGATQALYAPILRGAQKLGVLYLHTDRSFSEADYALLAAISEMLGANAKFQPESAHLRLPSVFISYSHKDTDFVYRLVADLRRQRVTVWFDERLRGGKGWQDQLAQAIQAADTFALVMSPDSLASEWVTWEISQARALGKPIFPLWHQPSDTVSDHIDALQRIDLLEDYQGGVLELVEELYALSGEADTLAPKASAPVVRSAGQGEKVRVLFLAANPFDTSSLRLSEEIRTIQERIRGGKYRDQFDMIQQAWAVRFSDLQQYLLEFQPHIVHFSGHGSSAGELIFEDNAGNSQPVSARALELLFSALKDEPGGGAQLVLLNACYSAVQAQAIAQEVGCVAGMTRAVSDRAAIEFAGAFYNALTFGKSVQVAFNLATASMALSDEEETPKLLSLKANCKDIIFCQENNA